MSSSELQDFKTVLGSRPSIPASGLLLWCSWDSSLIRKYPSFTLIFQKVGPCAKSLCCNSQISWSPQFLILFFFAFIFFQDGLTPLHCASRDGHDTVVEYLVNKKASIIARTKVCRIFIMSLVLFILIGCSYSRLSSEIKKWHGPFTKCEPQWLSSWLCSHCVVLENSHFYVYPYRGFLVWYTSLLIG